MATTYFWAATVQPAQRTPGAVAVVTLRGTVTALPTDTQMSLFDRIRDHITNDLQNNGLPGGHNVLFYTLQPNQL
jgi:hypothetical protein